VKGTRAADEAILLALREPGDPSNPIGPQWLETIDRDLTSLGSPTVLALITIAAVGYVWLDGKRAVPLFLVAAVAGGAVLESLLKLGFARPGPELVSYLVSVNSFSFPSGHTTMATITYLTLGVILARVHKRRRMKLYILAIVSILALLVGPTRISASIGPLTFWPACGLAQRGPSHAGLLLSGCKIEARLSATNRPRTRPDFHVGEFGR
jgi:undecaprenyl-diphosphatase